MTGLGGPAEQRPHAPVGGPPSLAAVEQLVVEARANAFTVKLGAPVGGLIVDEKLKAVIDADFRDRAERYLRWRVRGVQDGTVAGL